MNWPTNRINPDQTPGARGNGNRRPMPRGGNVIPQNRQAAASRTPVNRSNQSNSVNNLNNYGVTRPASSLTEGQIIKGEVTDLRNNAVVVTLENNTTVTAHIEDNSQLAIGETAAFRVSSISANGVVLTPLPKKDITLQMNTIQKALEAADLPKNDRNIELVHILMENQLPINKDTIIKMLQLTSQHKDASIETVIFMNKYNLPITQENTAQFERYKNQEHQFILEINRLCDSLPKLLETLSVSNAHSDFASIGSQILHILFDTETLASMTNDSNLSINPLNQINAENLNNTNTSFINETANLFLEQPAVFSSPEEASELLDILENASSSGELSDVFKESVLSGTASLKGIINVLEKAMYHSLSIDNQNLKNLNIPCRIDITPSGEIKYSQLPEESISNDSKAILSQQNNPSFQADTFTFTERETSASAVNSRIQSFLSFFQSKTGNEDSIVNENISSISTELLETTDKDLFFRAISDIKAGNFSQPLLCTDIFNNNVIHNLWTQYSVLQQNETALGCQLTLNQRYDFYELLKDFPLNDSLKDSLLSGQITSSALLYNLKNILPLSNNEQVRNLFQNKIFQDILKNELIDNFTLNPNDLKNKFKMSHHFDKIYTQLEELEELVHKNITSKNTDLAAQITNQATGQMDEQLLHQMKSNLDFMKTLNEMFSYIQLPLHLKNQTAHGELYVYTKKKTLMEHPKSIKVLLHLDLEHLKSIDIHITLENNHVDSKLYFSDEMAEKLIKTNLNLLETALSEKGYIAHTEILKMEKPANIITDFIKNDTRSSAVKRFSFDIRA